MCGSFGIGVALESLVYQLKEHQYRSATDIGVWSHSEWLSDNFSQVKISEGEWRGGIPYISIQVPIGEFQKYLGEVEIFKKRAEVSEIVS